MFAKEREKEDIALDVWGGRRTQEEMKENYEMNYNV